jgi:hypothetical protein
MQAIGTAPQEGRLNDARSQGGCRAVGQSGNQPDSFAGGRDPAMAVFRSSMSQRNGLGDGMHHRQET